MLGCIAIVFMSSLMIWELYRKYWFRAFLSLYFIINTLYFVTRP